jgi:hypothetical protein
MSLFQQRIYQLLKEKEEQVSTMEIASAWLSREAASVDRVNKMGTFRSVYSCTYLHRCLMTVLYHFTM